MRRHNYHYPLSMEIRLRSRSPRRYRWAREIQTLERALERRVREDSPDGLQEKIFKLQGRLSRIWANCKVIYYPKDVEAAPKLGRGLAYPVVHDPANGQNMQGMIETILGMKR